jgi:gluconate 2-dehydrogenase alpha chain
VPHGTPSWGSEWKRATVKWYHHFARFNTQGSVYANRKNFMDLDPPTRMRSAGR